MATTELVSSQIWELTQGPDAHASAQRALAFIDAQFPTVDDLDALDQASQSAQAKRAELQVKADASQQSTDKLLADTIASTRARLDSAQELSLTRHVLMDDLSNLNQELSSLLSDSDQQPTLLEQLETLQRKLHELHHVRDYIRTIHHALGLCEQAERDMRESKHQLSKSHPAILQYKALQTFVADVERACESADEGALAIVGFLRSVQRKAWSSIQEVVALELQQAAEVLKWPMPVKYEEAERDQRLAFEKAFRNLLHLQDIGKSLQPTGSEHTKTVPLYALQALVVPVALRFKFHFDGDRPTNRPDKPELFFTNILNASHQHRRFLEDYVQQLLDKSSFAHIDAWREFTRQLFPILVRKMRATVPLLLGHPALLAHMVYQVVAFDEAVRVSGFSLKGTMSQQQEEWDGLCDVILNNAEWFEAWLEGEKKFDYEQYDEIDGAADAWQIADEADEDGGKSSVRSTNSARRVKALIEQITDRYQPLPRVPQRVRFLVHIQLPLLDEYQRRIDRSLEAFAQLASSLAGVVPGGLSGQVDVNAKRLTSGVEGSTRLVKALLSARTMESALKGWGDDAFFLDLWAEIGKRPALKALAESNHLLPTHGNAEDSTVFDVLISVYDELCTRAQDMLVRQVVRDIEDDLQSYLSSPWEEQDTADPMTLPPGLAAPLAGLAAQLVFLRSTLPVTIAVSLYRRIASALAHHIVQRGIIYRGRGRVSHATAARFATEAQAWISTCQAALPREPIRRVEAPWAVLLEACALLTLEGEKFRLASRAVDNDLTYGAAMEELGLAQLARLDAREVVRARMDFVR